MRQIKSSICLESDDTVSVTVRRNDSAEISLNAHAEYKAGCSLQMTKPSTMMTSFISDGVRVSLHRFQFSIQ